jgi:hypothetical protein
LYIQVWLHTCNCIVILNLRKTNTINVFNVTGNSCTLVLHSITYLPASTVSAGQAKTVLFSPVNLT